MANKFGRVVELPPIKSHDPSITRGCEITCQTKTFMSLLPYCLWPPTWQEGNLPWQVLTQKAPDALITLSCEITWKTNYRISFITVLMATKLGRMVTYLEGFLTIKSSHALITWSCKVTWQTKTIISQLLECLWPPNLAGW